MNLWWFQKKLPTFILDIAYIKYQLVEEPETLSSRGANDANYHLFLLFRLSCPCRFFPVLALASVVPFSVDLSFSLYRDCNCEYLLAMRWNGASERSNRLWWSVAGG